MAERSCINCNCIFLPKFEFLALSVPDATLKTTFHFYRAAKIPPSYDTFGFFREKFLIPNKFCQFEGEKLFFFDNNAKVNLKIENAFFDLHPQPFAFLIAFQRTLFFNDLCMNPPLW